jgi:hypothetical protein
LKRDAYDRKIRWRLHRAGTKISGKHSLRGSQNDEPLDRLEGSGFVGATIGIPDDPE